MKDGKFCKMHVEVQLSSLTYYGGLRTPYYQ